VRQLRGLGAIDKRIIRFLQVDGRRAFTEMARELGVSEGQVRQRVRRLVREGVIQIVAVTDPLSLGFDLQALVGIRVDGDVRAAAEAVGALPEADYVVIASGRYDLLVEILCENKEDLLRIVNDSIRPIPGVRETETFVYLRLHKQTYQWGTR
jgi:Lrp/AsnC family transcriptional regulator for asnA, asnC and gidA